MRKYTLDFKALSKWTPNAAYTLGFIYADGHLEDAPYIRAQYLRVTSSDKDRLVFICKVLGSNHPIIKRPKFAPHHKDLYLIRIGSKKLYKELLNEGLTPHKSLTVRMPDIPDEVLHHFVRGYFDGDGCVFIERRLNKNDLSLIRRLSVTFTSGSRIFLEELGTLLLKKHIIDRIKIYRNGDAFQMRYSTREALRIYRFMYHKVPTDAYMKRKKDTFKEYMEQRGIAL